MKDLLYLVNSMQQSWGPDTCYNSQEWTKDLPSRGQCVVSSLLMQDYAGGDIIRYKTVFEGREESHYCNVLPDGTYIDTTRSQYPFDTALKYSPPDLGSFKSMRERLLSYSDTEQKYLMLKARVEELLETSFIH